MLRLWIDLVANFLAAIRTKLTLKFYLFEIIAAATDRRDSISDRAPDTLWVISKCIDALCVALNCVDGFLGIGRHFFGVFELHF